MAEVILRLNELSRNDKKALARSIVTGLTGNAKFPTPNPAPADITTAVTEVEAAEAAVAASEAQVAADRERLRRAEADLDNNLNRSARNAMDTTSEEADLRSANYPIKAPPAPVGILPEPINLLGSDGDLPLSILWTWNAVRRSTGYIVEMADAPDGPWKQVYVGTRSYCEIPNLEPGKLYYARVATQSTAGVGRWSEISNFRAR